MSFSFPLLSLRQLFTSVVCSPHDAGEEFLSFYAEHVGSIPLGLTELCEELLVELVMYSSCKAVGGMLVFNFVGGMV